MSENESKAERIRRLNDQLRETLIGGRVVLTAGVRVLNEVVRGEILAAVMEFDAFTEDNDPHQEHDFAAIEVSGQTIFWKIDYYDRAMKFLSPDPSDPAQTIRVLTIMLAQEY